MREMRQLYDINNYVVKLDSLGKIIIYLRKSREDMIDGRYASDEETLARHEEQLQQWAKNTLGYEIPQENIFKEVGSGEKIKTRPVFQEVLKMIEGEEVDGVLVLNCSRLSRGDLSDCGTIIKTFELTETLVLTPPKIYNINDKYDKRFFKDELLRGNDYLEQTKELLGGGRHWSASQGKYIHSVAPFGYDRVTCKEKNLSDGKGFTLKPNQDAQFVQLIFSMWLEGVGMFKIASHLKDIGAPFAGKTDWNHCKVRQILKNPHYCGYVTFGRRKKVEKMIDGEVIEKRVANPDCPTYKGLHKEIVSVEDFDRAQKRFKKRQPSTRHDCEDKNPFVSILKCAVCGRIMSRNVHTNEKKVKRVHDLDKADLQQFIKMHRERINLSRIEVARRLGLKRSVVYDWFGNNSKKFYPSQLFAEKWLDMKAVLQIEDDRFDKAITEFAEVTKEATIACSGHKCGNVSSNLSVVESKVLDLVKAKFDDYTFFLDNYEEEIIKKAASAKDTIAQIDKQIAMKERQLKNAKIAFEQGADSLQEYIDRKKELNEEMQELLDKKAEIDSAKEEEQTLVIKKAVPILRNVLDSYWELTPAERNELLKNIIESIMYMKTEKGNNDSISLDVCWLV
jgi:ribosome-binding protein aMBF1 (putative translation factor)